MNIKLNSSLYILSLMINRTPTVAYEIFHELNHFPQVSSGT